MGAPIGLDGVAVHPDCWCICLCYLHFAPENPEDNEKCMLFFVSSACSLMRNIITCLFMRMAELRFTDGFLKIFSMLISDLCLHRQGKLLQIYVI